MAARSVGFPLYIVLLAVQAIGAFTWAYAATLPIWIPVVGNLKRALLTALAFITLSTVLALFRYTLHGEVRKREYGPLPYVIRSVFLAAPTHALHGASIGLFAAGLLALQQQWEHGVSNKISEEEADERDAMIRDAFFLNFLHGWFFSSMFLLEKRQQLTFGRLSHKSRIQSIIDRAKQIVINIILLNLLGLFTEGWSPIWLSISVSLEFADAIFNVILSERSRPSDFEDGSKLVRAMNLCDGGSVQEAFKALPLVIVDPSKLEPQSSELMFRLPSAPDKTSLFDWWITRRNQGIIESSLTGSDPNHLLKLSKERFDVVTQMVYRCDALDEGAAFARFRRSMGLPKEAFRIRAFGLVSSGISEIPLINADDWAEALNASLNVLDAQALKLMTFVRVASKEQEAARNPDTGLQDTDAYIPKTEQMDDEKDDDRKRRAMDKAWTLANRRFVGKMWLQRMTLGNVVWEFDPIYEENLRKRRLTDKDRPPFLKRNFESALLDDFNLICRASEAAVCLCKKRKPASVSGSVGNVNSLVEGTLLRCAAACDEVEQLFEEQRISHDLLYALQFCLERDLQELRG